MSREFKAYLKDILESIQKIEKYTKELSFNKFASDDLVQDGVVRNLEIIGEAVKNIPDEIKNKKTEIDWRKIAGLRDILVHAYFGIDVDIVWDIIKNKIPKLKIEIILMLSETSYLSRYGYDPETLLYYVRSYLLTVRPVFIDLIVIYYLTRPDIKRIFEQKQFP